MFNCEGGRKGAATAALIQVNTATSCFRNWAKKLFLWLSLQVMMIGLSGFNSVCSGESDLKNQWQTWSPCQSCKSQVWLDRIGQHEVLLPVNKSYDNSPETN